MANHKSAEKRHRQNIKRRESNRFAKATFRTAIKSTLAAIDNGDKSKAEEGLKLSTKLLDKAAIHGVLHRKNASRRVSRLTKKVNALSA